jgi:3-oxoadipate enol-lactonase
MPIVQTTDRFALNYVTEGEGHPVVLIHGLAGDHTAWMPQIAALKGRYKVIAFDNPGSGASSSVEGPVTTEELADAALRLMDRLGVKHAHVIGRSMGGAIAQHMALSAPERVTSLAFAASFARFDAVGTRILSNMREVLEWRQNWTDWARHAVWTFVAPEFFNENPEIVARIEALIGDESRSKVSYAHLNHACLAHDTLSRLDEIRCPTLIMAGRLDPICSMTATRWMQEAMPAAESVIFEKSSHFFLMEEPQKAMATIEAWLSRHTPAA